MQSYHANLLLVWGTNRALITCQEMFPCGLCSINSVNPPTAHTENSPHQDTKTSNIISIHFEDFLNTFSVNPLEWLSLCSGIMYMKNLSCQMFKIQSNTRSRYLSVNLCSCLVLYVLCFFDLKFKCLVPLLQMRERTNPLQAQEPPCLCQWIW